MPLNPSVMKAELLTFFKPGVQPRSIPQAAAKWAKAYDTYGRAATDVSGDLVATVNRPGFQSALRFAPTNTAAQVAAEFEQAFIAYWTGAVFAVGVPPSPAAACPSVPPSPPWAVEASSVVLSVTPGLASLLTPIFQNVSNRPTRVVAGEIADAFHAATTTNVLVLITGVTTPPPPAGLPVTNTCTVF